MNSVLLITCAVLTVTTAVPYVARVSCTNDADCLRGFPATVPTLVCSKSSVCEARNPHWCNDSSDCKDALTTCVAKKCVHGARGAPCSSRADCGIGLHCSTKGRCTHGTPGTPCSTATAVECDDGLTCAPDGKCVPGLFNTRCVLDRNCADGFYCELGRCAAGAKPLTVKYYPWGSPPPMLEKSAGFSQNAVGVPQVTVEATVEPIVGMSQNAMGSGLSVSPEPSPVGLIPGNSEQTHNAFGSGFVITPEPIPVRKGNGMGADHVMVEPEPTKFPMIQAALGAGDIAVTPEPVPFPDVTAPPRESPIAKLVTNSVVNNAVTVTTAPTAPEVTTVPGFATSNAMSGEAEPTVAPVAPEVTTVPGFTNSNAMGTVPDTTFAPIVPIVTTEPGFANSNAIGTAPEPSVGPEQPTQEVTELTQPLTVQSFPTAIPIPKRKPMARRKATLSHIFVTA